ncbi:fatty acid desaturase [Ferruginibacter sp.]|uniref:fatty acid desaturase family protein n=1 Tax=Ferruginibacter sp. TaxID=1940288 RepID=UPI00265A74D6|nr:fatty acid desaturase [Ferruginibacter sp.]
MLLGKNLILATKPFAKEIRSKSWFHATSTLALLILALGGSLAVPGIILKLLCSVIAGLLLIRMFIIYHDYQHHTILTHSPVAEVIMTVFGMYMLSPASIWKRSHDHHHNHNSKLFSASIGSYPIVTRKKYMEMSRFQKFTYLAVRHPVTIALGYFSMFIIGMCLRSFVSNPKKHFDSLIALVIHITVAVLLFVFIGWQAWFFMFFLPFLIAFAIGAYLFYAQHNFPGVEFYENKNWVYEKAALESSSFMKMNPVMEWFTGNIGYHHIHHLNSKIPFYRLPEVMRHFTELQNCKVTRLTPKAMSACFKLKVWDQESNQMIGVKGLHKMPA